VRAAVELDGRHDVARRRGQNTAGVIALVEDTAVVEIQKALAEADEIVTKAVDKQTALEIDREAAAAKASMGA
jgi:hypothetical protein